MSKHWKAADIPSLAGKRVLVTGANSGIGYHTALKLARKGAHVILACRDRQRGEDAIDRIQADSAGVHVELAILDLASLDSIREFAAQQLALQHPLHILINNAGVMAPPGRLETVDGYELQFGTNVLGHFALTALLMPAIQRAASSSASAACAPRIVTIASIAHKRGQINFNDLQSTQSYSPMKAYQQSKLGNLLIAFELDRRLRAAHSPIISIAAHPGVAETNLFVRDDHPPFEKAVRSIVGHAIGTFLNTDSEGALPTLYAATAPNVEGGSYYGPQGFQEMRGEHVGHAQIAPQAHSINAAVRLWQICEQLTGTQFPPL
jgi:NAD(P)-dependent dehydrogenase (short-subunit alcohol dehydrogenase family)